MIESLYRSLPSVDKLVSMAPLSEVTVGASARVAAARDAIAAARDAISNSGQAPTPETIAEDAARRAEDAIRCSIRQVLNATGIVVHTNLGRAPLQLEAVARAVGACNLEMNLETGRRGSRRDHVERLLRDLSGAEAALVVNNNAAALMLMLATFTSGREVIISRGELVEIGGSFRVPDMIRAAGATLVEVGTTNRTHLSDYEAAIGPQTAAILRVHPSNFHITGFTHQPTGAELADLAHAHELRIFYDMGSAAFAPLPHGLSQNVNPTAELEAGADLVCFSGDKILGGPQAGILLGDKSSVDPMAHHPMARAFRMDKIGLSALEHVLSACVAGRFEEIPVWKMLHTSVDDLRQRCLNLQSALGQVEADVDVETTQDAVGGGSHPGETIEGVALTLRPHQIPVDQLSEALRLGEPAVVGAIHDDRLWLHLRTVEPGEDEGLGRALLNALRGDGSGE